MGTSTSSRTRDGADIGTKALSAARLQFLKDLLCLAPPVEVEGDGVQDQRGREVGSNLKRTSSTMAVEVEAICQALRALTL